MLNEIYEYELYLSNSRNEIPLRNETTQDSFTGIRRPLQVLARGFLHICQEESLPLEQAMKACKVFLYGWVCGEIHEDYKSLKLTKVLERECEKARTYSFLSYALHGKTEEEAQKTEWKCRDKAREWYHSPYSKGKISKFSTFNQVYFAYIIADALYLGKRKNQCLLLRKSYEKTYGLDGDDNGRKIALAFVCQYLQLQQIIGKGTNRTFIPVVQAEIGNWVNVRPKKSGNQTSVPLTIERVTIADKTDSADAHKKVPLIEKISMACLVKIRIHPDWIRDTGVKLVPADEIEDGADVVTQNNEKYLVIRDKDLLVNKR